MPIYKKKTVMLKSIMHEKCCYLKTFDNFILLDNFYEFQRNISGHLFFKYILFLS